MNGRETGGDHPGGRDLGARDMREDLSRLSAADPVKAAQAAPRPLPRRFYKEAGVSANAGGRFQILLDGRPVRTPAKRPLDLPTAALAEAVAAEWRAQGETIDPQSMPLTRLANVAIDGVADAKSEVAADIVAFAGSDLVCYRADHPPELAALQAEAWDPVLEWAKQALGARFVLAEGVMPVEQPARSLDRVAGHVAAFDPLRLTALHQITTLTGSALIALAHEAGALDVEAAWAAAHVDEDFQIARWGEDAEAMERREVRRREMAAASRFLELMT